MTKEKQFDWSGMKVKINRLDFSWSIEVNGKPTATVWMNHNRPKGTDWEVMQGILEELNTINIDNKSKKEIIETDKAG